MPLLEFPDTVGFEKLRGAGGAVHRGVGDGEGFGVTLDAAPKGWIELRGAGFAGHGFVKDARRDF